MNESARQNDNVKAGDYCSAKILSPVTQSSREALLNRV